MRAVRNGQAERELYTRLTQKYSTPKPEPHLTELIYCLTKAYYDRTAPLRVSDKETVMFAIGFGLEQVILRGDDDTAPVSQELDGIWLTPDYVMLTGGGMDLKSTRMYPDADGSPKRGFSETWLEQFMGYAYLDTIEAVQYIPDQEIPYSVGIVYLVPAELTAWTLYFSKAELEANWAKLQVRRMVLKAHRRANTVPEPFKWNRDWECKDCRYKMRCDAWAAAQKGVA